jgi:ribosomal protein S6E (S10)
VGSRRDHSQTIEIQDDKKLQPFYDKRMSHEIDGTLLGPEYAGYVFKVRSARRRSRAARRMRRGRIRGVREFRGAHVEPRVADFRWQ